MANFGQLALALAAPVLTAGGGGVAAAYRPPTARLLSAVQHFAAGLVFAAASAELVPDLLRGRHPVPVAIGFAMGLALMLAVKYLPGRMAPGRSDDDPTAALVAVGIDVLVDGMLIGIGFAAGGRTGVLLSVALTVELAFLGLAVAGALQACGAPRRRIITTTFGIALLVIVGGAAGDGFVGRLGGAALSGVLAFGTVALLYLVTEELLTEAHETPDTPALTSMFFAGFLALLLLDLAS